MRWIKDDGGRAAAGYKGHTGDCSCRSIAIATGKPYQEVYDALNELARTERPRGRRAGRRSSARTGVRMETIRRYMRAIGWRWVATMRIGSGCTVRLRESELPPGKLVVRVSKHMTAVVDGVIHDNHDPSRGGTRCVYGYFCQSN